MHKSSRKLSQAKSIIHFDCLGTEEARKFEAFIYPKEKEARWAYLFISPFIIGFLVFMLGPMLFSYW